MCLRIFSLLALPLVLAGCGGETSPPPQGAEVECALGPGAELAKVCTLQKLTEGAFIIHHPDGGFRRFAWDENGHLTTADGAELITSERLDTGANTREFALEVDRYRIPANLVAPPGYE